MENISQHSPGGHRPESNTKIEKPPFARKEMKRQWLLVTEAIRQEILAEPSVRALVQGFTSEPVDETLPRKLLAALAPHPRLTDLIHRYQNELVAYLDLSPTPDKHMQPDIRHATDITLEERNRVIQRYQFARDIKLLALQAETAQLPDGIHLDHDHTATLPGGVSITTNLAEGHERDTLLDPNNWVKRQQIKDRVYEIQVGESSYILKEKKTNRHTDTYKTGHQETASSQEEFDIARHYQEHAIVVGDIKANWEQPVAAVTFPDGYQFVVYEYTEGLMDIHESRELLVQQILEHREQFEAEYQKINSTLNDYYNDPKVLAYESQERISGLRGALIKFGLIKEKVDASEFGFDDYAKLKSIHMHVEAYKLLQEQHLKSDCVDRDGDKAFRVNTTDGQAQLEIFGFDFEYFYKFNQGEHNTKRTRSKARNRRTNPFVDIHARLNNVSRIQRAAYLAILDLAKETESKER